MNNSSLSLHSSFVIGDYNIFTQQILSSERQFCMNPLEQSFSKGVQWSVIMKVNEWGAMVYFHCTLKC